MFKKIVIPAIVALAVLAYLLSCGSNLNTDQLSVQQQYTHKLSGRVQDKLAELSVATNSYSSTENLYKVGKEKFPALDSVFILNDSLKISELYPEEKIKGNNPLYQIFRTKVKDKLQGNSFPQIYFSKDYNKFWFFRNISNSVNKYLVLKFDTYLFFKDFKKLYFPIPYNLAIINKEQRIIFSEKDEMIGDKFFNIEGREAVYNIQHLQDKIMQNDLSYSLNQYDNTKSYVTALFSWEAVNVLNKKFWIVVSRYIPSKRSEKEDQSFLLASLRSYAVKDTLIKSIINQKTRAGGKYCFWDL